MSNETALIWATLGADRAGSMLTFIVVIHLMIVLAMCGLVLLQKSEGGGLGIGSTGGFMTSRGTTNVLTRSTAILAACFFATSLLLSVIAGWNRNPGSILQRPGAPVSTPGAPAPKAPSGNLLDQLKGQEKGPLVPQSK
jgi:preprotein translocase subunit SecG